MKLLKKNLKLLRIITKKKGLRDGTKFLIITAIALVFMIIISFAIFFALRKHFFKIYTNKEADIVIAPAIIRTPSEIEDISLISSSSSLPVSVDPTISKSINCDVLYNKNRKTSIGHNTEPFMIDKLKKFIEEDREDKSSSESHNQNNPDSNPPPYSEI
ncbi:hypothetical protein U3516DRAFT_657077 [Neocallimastix sp. 'constans']